MAASLITSISIPPSYSLFKRLNHRSTDQEQITGLINPIQIRKPAYNSSSPLTLLTRLIDIVIFQRLQDMLTSHHHHQCLRYPHCPPHHLNTKADEVSIET
jgi:hypothetical protein